MYDPILVTLLLGRNSAKKKLSSYESYHFWLAETILAEVKFSSRNEALQKKTKTSRNVLPFIATANKTLDVQKHYKPT